MPWDLTNQQLEILEKYLKFVLRKFLSQKSQTIFTYWTHAECFRDSDWTLVKLVRRLFSSHFWPPFTRAAFLGRFYHYLKFPFSPITNACQNPWYTWYVCSKLLLFLWKEKIKLCVANFEHFRLKTELFRWRLSLYEFFLQMYDNLYWAFQIFRQA